MNITLFGGTGGVGQHLTRFILEAGHDLCLLVRTPAKVQDPKHDRLTILQGDATDDELVRQAIEGSDVVISCLGNSGKNRIMYTAHDAILRAAAAQSAPPRCLMVSSIGCGGTSLPVKLLLSLFIGPANFQDYEKGDQRVREETNVPCVLVRPTALTNKPSLGGYHIIQTKTGTFAKSIPRADVALFFMDALTDLQWDGEAVMLERKKENA